MNRSKSVASVLHLGSTRLAASALAALAAATLFAQEAPRPAQPPAAAPAAQGRGGPQAPQFVSPEVAADGRITFRIYAPRRRRSGSRRATFQA